MQAAFVRDRITELRIQKGVSEYKMSYDLGHSRGYINNITSGKTLPSMTEFFAICEYFEISPVEFFQNKDQNPHLARKLSSELSELSADDASLIQSMVERLLRK